MSDLIDRQQAIYVCRESYEPILDFTSNGHTIAGSFEDILNALPSADLPKEYAKSVWLWILNYQIKTAELRGRYTPYEVLSWVANDWRKDNGLD